MNTKPQKIALVYDAIYPYNVGGKEKRMYELSTRLAKRGHQVTVYCMKWWDGPETTRIENGVTLKAISPLYPLYHGERRSMEEAIKFAFHCFKLIKEDFDIIDADHMPHLVLFPIKIVSLIKRKRFFGTWNEVWGTKYWVSYLGPLGYIASLVESVSLMLPDVILSVGKHTTISLKKHLKVNKKIITVPCGMTLFDMKKITPAKETSDIIFAARLLKHKNADKLIDAVAILKKTNPKIRCFIVGNGPEEQNLKAQVKRLGLVENVIFYDFFKNHEDLYKLIKASKLFVSPSDREGFGIALLEALSLGVPAITYDHPDNGSRYLIEEGINGYLFNDTDKPLYQMIEKVYKTKLSSESIKKTTIKYDWDNIADQLEEAYRS